MVLVSSQLYAEAAMIDTDAVAGDYLREDVQSKYRDLKQGMRA